jgi:hypothetical protein
VLAAQATLKGDGPTLRFLKRIRACTVPFVCSEQEITEQEKGHALDEG